MRIGQGVDVHAFRDGGTLVLGGVTIPYERSLEAHSDGDVVLHSLCDALLGAAALGDIGRQFPPTDAAYEDIDSRILLRKTHELLQAHYFKVVNVDITVIAQAPKLSVYVDTMCEHISADLQLKVSRVNVKATTTEYLGFTGRGEGIAALAVVLIESR